MKWYSNLYISKSIGRKAPKIKWKINHNIPVRNIYVITLPSNPSNLLDMIPVKYLLKKKYPKDNIKIVGLAKGYDNGIKLIKQIVDESINATGSVNLVAFLKSRERVQE